MKTNKQISKLVATAAMAVAAIAPSFAQSNLGAACGCPAVASRTIVELSSLPGYTAIAGINGGELMTGATLTCDKMYIIDKKIYIPAGQVLNIAPGTVLKGRETILSSDATALVIERGGKINASGESDCQIVFTAEADPVNGTYGIENKGKWGGVVLLGKATNNLTLAKNGPYVPGGSGKLAVANGLGIIEGFATADTQNQYGVDLNSGSFDDNDNSGIMKYVSIRHSGAILAVGAEINGLTLGSVGRGTTIEHIEIVSCADDNIELFGGTVNLKYISVLFGNDDMYDYDLGWTGKGQFLFGMKTDITASVDSDSGFEADSDDNKSNNLPKSHPVFYNVTLIGNDKAVGNVDNGALAAIMAKEATEGEFYNSVFANFRNGFTMQKALGSRVGGVEAYDNWINGSLQVKCNTFVGTTNPATFDGSKTSGGTALVGDDLTKFTTTDLNTVVAGNTLPGFSYTFTVNNATNVFSVKNDVVPNPALSTAGCPTAPVDGFFRAAAYRGAFSSDPKNNWLSDWSYSQVLNTTKGLVSCPTDINGDGTTNVSDFLQLSGSLGTSCN